MSEIRHYRIVYDNGPLRAMGCMGCLLALFVIGGIFGLLWLGWKSLLGL